ncbi:MAG TPA: hypothetical protein VFZ01_05865 [Geminicoccaceae bacterium]
MAKDRQKHDKAPPHPGKRRPEDRDRPAREKDPKDRNGDVDEGLEETFPASDPPAPSRPTGAE